jgi:hypothetical protein
MNSNGLDKVRCIGHSIASPDRLVYAFLDASHVRRLHGVRRLFAVEPYCAEIAMENFPSGACRHCQPILGMLNIGDRWSDAYVLPPKTLLHPVLSELPSNVCAVTNPLTCIKDRSVDIGRFGASYS